uniref:Protein mono-ADP-ribosyltransferase PARP9 isoform X1 n=1 Tax=Geotrypetes seraphini TaxID=260995 RepID=A0A6P8RE37_GEOSA|nr:protein mono-ADP-ribosyltransferase PARP9 isoform X1 [Geotrypetes seraphini]XP_033801129.1 protein mono-ADP-ribosyltransferase PARP9 isoform X1 [Geotrypetes seraphini]XP_033801130.1 protein mono-ADP-ribosyltransferase PARP9 isoform X1 [Geotrypetes seraphini]XP_033801131.1 protein mono-ADP-ribosyltransferase PARP9 isoform X1 [Geotrypetes seraphini]XP_033801132.1 protein mono-ADP-ribosyltransferase PARP9 isoform X1 [Geotrypetes seraphini]
MARSKDITYSETKSESELFDRTEISISIRDDVFQALTESEGLLSDVIEKKFDCASYLTGSASLATQTSTVHPTRVYMKTWKEVQFSVWKDDLTNHRVDAVVNAANKHLDHAGGLAFALMTAGGKEVEKESKMWVEQHGDVLTGKIAVTTGGRLPCKCIIHAVGPIWNMYQESTCKQKLENAITEILKYVNKNPDIRSVAIPALSSGIYGFPLDLCATIIVTTIKDFCQQTPLSPHLKEIHLVNHDDRTVTAMKEACEKILDNNGSSSSSLRLAMPSIQASDSISVNGLHLQLIRGCIEDQKTTVIVNSTSEKLDLSEGQISGAILKKAGFDLQNELCKKTNHLPLKSLICTRGHKLSCDFVYHILWSSGAKQEKLQQAVVECLKLAQDHQTPSVSFPALGTGVLKLPRDQVAHIMTSEVLKFAELFPGKKPDICFVIYPSDNETFKAFQRELDLAKNKLGISKKSQKRPDNSANLSHFSDVEKRDHKSDVPTIRLRGKDHMNVSAAETWIQNTLLLNQERLFIENQHIFYCGKREHESLSGYSGVSISINLSNGNAKIEIEGPLYNAIRAVLQTEKMLCDVQDEYARHEEEELLQSVVQWSYATETHTTNYGAAANKTLEKAWVNQKDVEVDLNGSYHTTRFNNKTVTDSKGQVFQLDRKYYLEHDYRLIQSDLRGSGMFYTKFLVASNTQEFLDRKREFEKANLQIVKMEKVCNPILTVIYQARKDDVQRKQGNRNVLRKLYHEVPIQFCDFVCRVGFQRVYAQPQEQNYGAGLYFYNKLKMITCARKKPLWEDNLICILQAEVVVGQYTVGKQSYVVPPINGSDFLDLYDSVVDSSMNPETFVIFNSSQANPQYLFTCKQKWGSSV